MWNAVKCLKDAKFKVVTQGSSQLFNSLWYILKDTQQRSLCDVSFSVACLAGCEEVIRFKVIQKVVKRSSFLYLGHLSKKSYESCIRWGIWGHDFKKSSYMAVFTGCGEYASVE